VRLLGAAALALLAAALLQALPAAGDGGEAGEEEVLARFEYYVLMTERMIREAVEAYERGDVEEAFRLARDAYIEYFELLEIPLRAVDPQFVVEMELEFAELRSMIKAGESPEAVRAKAREILDGMERVSFYLDQLANPEAVGRAAGIAVFLSASIILREGLEAVIILAVLYAVVYSLRRRELVGRIWMGALAALPAVAATWLAVGSFIDLAGVGRAAAEAILGIAALAVVALVGRESLRALAAARRGGEWLEFVRASVWEKASRGGAAAVATLAFIAVYREGLEAVLLYQALLRMAEGFEQYVAAGFILGMLLVASAGVIVAFLGVRVLPLRAFAAFSAALVGYIIFMLTGNVVDELQDLGVVGVTPIESLVGVITPSISDVTGMHPTVETMAAQAAALAVYAAAAAYYLRVVPARLGASGEG
jgi:high-affinity iron transporter